MIYLTCGTDKNKARDKHLALARLILAKQPEATYFKISVENFSPAEFEEFISAQTLFVRKFVVSCDNLLRGKISKEFVMDKIAELADSENIFLFLEDEDPLAKSASMEDKEKAERRHKEIEKLKKVAVKTQEFSKPAMPEFNIYSIVDAFAARDKNQAWMCYEEALLFGVSPEEVLWKIIWQVDNMLLVKKTKDEKELNLKPFVLGKAKRAAQKFETKELEKLSGELVDLYHETYLGSDEFEYGLEKILLGV